MKTPFHFVCAALLAVAVTGCTAAQQRGMQGDAYVSSTRPAIEVKVQNLPLRTFGSGTAALTSSGVLGGLPVQVWLAVYGKTDAKSPLAVVAQAEVPSEWYWDSDTYKPFSINQGVEVFDNVGYQACTYIVDGAGDAFSGLVAADAPDGEAKNIRWIVRGFAARYNFNYDKIVMQYREPLPADITSLSALPMGRGDFVKAFEQRARETFVVKAFSATDVAVRKAYANSIYWQYMGENFLGTVSKYDSYGFN